MSSTTTVQGHRIPVPRRASGSGIGFRSYLSVRGATLWDSARLYVGYAGALGEKLLVPRRYECVGAVLPGAGWVTVRMGGVRARVRPGTNDLDLLAHHEPLTRAWFRVQPGDTVVDVGAHIGLYTLRAARLASRVVAFEPDPANFEILTENVELNDLRNVSLVRGAVSDRAGQVEVVPARGTNRGTSSVRVPHAEELQPGGSLGDTRCDTLDAWLEPYSLSRIDWLKVDVEGHEREVLVGAAASLAKTRHLVLEVSSGHEQACRTILEAAGLVKAGEEPGYPTSNWFLERGV